MNIMKLDHNMSRHSALAWPQGFKTVFVFNSVEHEIFSADKYENANNIIYSYLLAAMFCKKEFAIVSKLRFISMKKFMLS